MIGVVLWRDEARNKAVIWCEDHGDLAFYANEAMAGGQELSPGDWVEFDLSLSGNFRFARNLEILQERASADLPGQLSDAARGAAAPAASGREGPIVIPFAVRAAENRRAGAPVQARRG